MISPPFAFREAAIAFVIDPIPPREYPHAPTVPSTSPI